MAYSYLDRQRQRRNLYVRSDADILLNTPDGWMSPGAHGPIRWGDYPTADPPSWWMGRDTFDGRPIGPNGPWLTTSESVMPGVTRCTEVIVNTVVRTQWRYFVKETGEFFGRPLWIDDPMLIGKAPGPILAPLVPAGLRLDGHSFYATWLTHAIWWGLGAFVCIEASDGTPLPGSLRIVNPYMVGLDERGHWVLDPGGETPVVTDAEGRFSLAGRTWRLVVLRGLGPNDGRAAEGVLARHFATFKVGAAVSEYVASTFTAGVPAGFLKVSTPNVKEAEVDKLRETWMKAHGSGRRSIAVLSSTVDFSPISLSPIDANVEGVVHTSRADVAHAFGLSAIWLDEGASGLTYQNNSDRRRDLVDVSLAGWSERMMAVLTALMPYGQRVEVSWLNFTNPSLEAHVPALVQGVQAGLFTATEARQFIGLTRQTGPDPHFHDNSPASKEPQPIPAQLLSVKAGNSESDEGADDDTTP